jgi:hypothetical protein
MTARNAELANVQTRDDGSVAFRLLLRSLPVLEVEGVEVRLEDAVNAWIQRPDGTAAESPVVKVALTAGGRTERLELLPGVPADGPGCTITLRYVLDASIDGGPREEAVHLALKGAGR